MTVQSTGPDAVWERLEEDVCHLGDLGERNVTCKGVNIVVCVCCPPSREEGEV